MLLDITRSIYPNVEAVFVDTGLEYPELRQFVKETDNVTWIKPEMNFRKVIETYGYPVISKNVSRAISDVKRLGKSCWFYGAFNGREKGFYNFTKYKYLIDSPFQISNKCCDIMKKKPLHKFHKTSGKYPLIATMACESIQRKNHWLQNGCNSFDSKDIKSQPMSFWTEQDVFQYIKKYNLRIAPVYGKIVEETTHYKRKQNKPTGKLTTTGCNRTGCVFCAYGCHLEKEPNRFQMLKLSHPKLWEYCMRDWDKGGLGMKVLLDYIGVKTE